MRWELCEYLSRILFLDCILHIFYLFNNKNTQCDLKQICDRQNHQYIDIYCQASTFIRVQLFLMFIELRLCASHGAGW